MDKGEVTDEFLLTPKPSIQLIMVLGWKKRVSWTSQNHSSRY